MIMTTFDNEMQEIVESFIVESSEIIEQLGPDLLALEKNPTDNELQNTIFRAVHTIKGTSSFLGFEDIMTLAHEYEEVLNKIRKGDLSVTASIMDVMFEAYDYLKTLIEKIKNKDDSPIELDGITEKLKTISGSGGESEHVGECVQSSKPPQFETGEIKESPADTVTQKLSGETTIRVNVTRLDAIMDLVGELVLGRNRLSLVTEYLNEKLEGDQVEKDLSESYSQIDFITTELQMAVMKARMVPLTKVFNKLPRLVRDLERETGKMVELSLIGADNELDKTIVEELNDPLVHILRNALDHGIELPEERKAVGKRETGAVIVKAEQQGNNTVITIKDDGRGLDADKLKRKAIEKKLITAEQAQNMTDKETFQLIFAPGLSTAKKVTSVSGRGVGMDVVRTNIQKLKGMIDIESSPGNGSTFIIKLPITLAIIQGLLTKAGDEVFAIPISSIVEVLRVRKSDIQTIDGHAVIRLRDTVLSLVHLSKTFGVISNGSRMDWLYVVVIGLAEMRIGIVVDSLLGQREVVIKSFGEYLGNIPGLAGSTILGDGSVIMIIDVGQLIEMCVSGQKIELKRSKAV